MMSLLSFGPDGWGRLILSAACTTLLLSLAALIIGAVVGSGVAVITLIVNVATFFINWHYRRKTYELQRRRAGRLS